MFLEKVEQLLDVINPCLGITEDNVITIILAIITGLTSFFVAYKAMREKALKTDIIATVEQKISDEYNPKLQEIKDNIKELLDIQNNIIKDAAVSEDRIKSIFHKMGEISSEALAQLEKMEKSLKEDMKEYKEDFREQNKDIRAQLKDIWEKKKDKAS